jgi:hypothetical protein
MTEGLIHNMDNLPLVDTRYLEDSMRAVACFVNWFVYDFIEIPRNASRVLADAYAMPVRFATSMDRNQYS